MNNNTIGDYFDNRRNVEEARKQLAIAKSQNRPVVRIKQGVFGEMIRPPVHKKNLHFSPLSEQADEFRQKASELMEKGMQFKDIAVQLNRKPGTISNYFKRLKKEKGPEWAKEVKHKIKMQNL